MIRLEAEEWWEVVEEEDAIPLCEEELSGLGETLEMDAW